MSTDQEEPADKNEDDGDIENKDTEHTETNAKVEAEESCKIKDNVMIETVIKDDQDQNLNKQQRPVTAMPLTNNKDKIESRFNKIIQVNCELLFYSDEKPIKPRPKTAPAPAMQEKKIPMDPMRALASLEFVSARGLETSDTGPKILANHASFITSLLFDHYYILLTVWNENDED